MKNGYFLYYFYYLIRHFVYFPVTIFPNLEKAEDFLNTENTWGRKITHKTRQGLKRFYRCNRVPKKGPQCAARLNLLIESGTNKVFMYRMNDHNHDEIGVNNFGIPARTKIEINKLFELHLKPRDMISALKKMDGIRLPTKLQLYNYVTDIRRRIKLGQKLPKY